MALLLIFLSGFLEQIVLNLGLHIVIELIETAHCASLLRRKIEVIVAVVFVGSLTLLR